MTRPTVVKLGGELIETPEARARVAAAVKALAQAGPLVIVHGGGRSIDADLGRLGIAPKKIDGLRVTDAEALDVVVGALAGRANTRLVASLVTHGVAAVGLTGVDAGLTRAPRSAAHRTTTGDTVDLGLVGDPDDVDPGVIEALLARGFVPVVASLGLETGSGAILNVNADVMACRLAAALGAGELVIAGATPGVLDGDGRTIAVLDPDGIERLVADQTATAGMIAKLIACRAALETGVGRVRIVDGRGVGAGKSFDAAPGTTLLAGTLAAAASQERTGR